MSSQLKTTYNNDYKAFLRYAKRRNKAWLDLECKDLPFAEIEELALDLIDAFFEHRDPQLLEVAKLLFKIPYFYSKYSFQGIVGYTEACLLTDDLENAKFFLDEMEDYYTEYKDYDHPRYNNAPKEKIYEALHRRINVRIELLKGNYQSAIDSCGKLSDTMLNRDPHIRILASIANLRVGAKHEEHSEKYIHEALRYANDYAARFGSDFDVYIQRAMAYEQLEDRVKTYENFQAAYDSIEKLAKKEQTVQRTILSLTLWNMMQGSTPLKQRLKTKTITHNSLLVDRVELLRRLSTKANWEGMLEESRNISLDTMTATEACAVSFAAIATGDLKRAREVLEATGHDDDGNVQRLHHMARLNYVEGKLDVAAALAEKAARFCISANTSESFASHIIQMAVHLLHEHAHRNKDYDHFIKFLSALPKDWDSNDLKILRVQMMMNSDTVHHQRVYVKRAMNLLKTIKLSDRGADWYILSGRLLMINEQFATAIKNFLKAQKVLDNKRKGADTLKLIIENSIEECQRALHENETGEGEGIIGHMRLLSDALEEKGVKVHRVVMVEEGSMPIAIIERPGNTTQKAHLMTMALSFRQAPFENAKPAEMGIAIPKSEIDDITKNDWRVRLLTTLSISLQASHGLRPRNGMTLKHPDGKSIIEGVNFPSVVLYESWDNVLPDSLPVALVEVVPVYDEENDYAALMGADRLLQRLMDIPFYPTFGERHNAMAGQNWKMLIPRKNIRRLYEDNGRVGCVNKSILIDGADSAIFYRVGANPESPNDSGWYFLTGNEKESDIGESDLFVMMDLNTICNYIPYIIPYLEAPEGSAFVRDASGSISSTTTEKSALQLQKINKKPLLA